MDKISHTLLLSVLEQAGQKEKVDRGLKELSGTDGLKVDEVVLGTLLDVAGRGHEWVRAEQLWVSLCTGFGVRPNVICYAARAKVHLLCGRPRTAVRVMNQLLKRRLLPQGCHTDRSALIHLQAMVICCHAEPSEPNLQALKKLVKDHKISRLGKSVGKEGKQQLKKLLELSRQLASSPVAFRDLLVIGSAREGLMRTWPDHPMGSRYLTLRKTKSGGVRLRVAL